MIGFSDYLKSIGYTPIEINYKGFYKVSQFETVSSMMPVYLRYTNNSELIDIITNNGHESWYYHAVRISWQNQGFELFMNNMYL